MKALLTGVGLAAVAMATAGTVHADEYCREYQRRVTIGGKIQDSYGTACLQPDGSWKTVSEGEPELVGSVAPEPVYAPQRQPVIVYEEEPLYVPFQTTYRSYTPAPVWWGVNLSFNDRHGWHDNRWRNTYHRPRDHGHNHRRDHDRGGRGRDRDEHRGGRDRH